MLLPPSAADQPSIVPNHSCQRDVAYSTLLIEALETKMIRPILLGVALILSGCGVEQAAAPRTLSVSGTGTIAVTPDVAIVRLGVESRADTSDEALSQNSAKTNAVIEALKALGVEDKSIRTESVQLNPRYEHIREPNGRSSQTLVGYRASNLIRVELSELSNAGSAIDAASKAGANRIDSIGFEVSDPTAALVSAREVAWRDALSQAEQLAGLADAKLGKVIQVSTHNSTSGPVHEMAFARAAMDAVPVSGGQQNVTVQLAVSWSLVDQSGAQ